MMLRVYWQVRMEGLLTSKGRRYSTPSILMSPSEVVTLRANFSIHCKCEDLEWEESRLYQMRSSLRILKMYRREENETVFPIFGAKPSDAGIYWCQYCSVLPTNISEDKLVNNSKCQKGKKLNYQPANQTRCSYDSKNLTINIIDSSLPKPSFKMRSMEQVSSGMNFVIKCQGPNKGLNFSLHKSRDLIKELLEQDRDTAEFTFSAVRLEDAGKYTFQYQHTRYPFVWSVPSEPMELYVTDSTLTKPSIHLWPEGPHTVDSNVTIECQGPENGLNFSLFQSNDVRTSESIDLVGNTTKFFFRVLRLEDAGNYTCQYHQRGNWFVLSVPSEAMQLIVTAPLILVNKIRLGVASLVLIALGLIITEAVYSWRREAADDPEPASESLQPSTSHEATEITEMMS
ncbi:T-cell-interacting, activating receptor on myeloid cells protein 1-like [Hemicordylus capensis]|uniref:T-cell-interacting, activating receptor on myeloid cells protein 1-like n=1 Tax=Hemicordylus capensis TaxID=884348 RepID=UPI0023045264|nr:T-cell-interacting, activating receptor on myeloid cells protein 1-like [Hemicordylus capensis]